MLVIVDVNHEALYPSRSPVIENLNAGKRIGARFTGQQNLNK